MFEKPMITQMWVTDKSMEDRFHKPIEFTFMNHKLIFLQTNHDLGTTVWDSGMILAKYIETIELKNKTVIELGSGVGIVGICASLLGANVYLTDLNDNKILDVLKKNVNNNLDLKVHKATVMPLVWGERKHAFEIPKHIDIILAADVIYDDRYVGAFIFTLCELADEKTEIFIAYERHKKEAEEFFWKEAQEFFKIEKINIDPKLQKKTVNVLRLKKKSVREVQSDRKNKLNKHIQDIAATGIEKYRRLLIQRNILKGKLLNEKY